jgi:hypothetical protein
MKPAARSTSSRKDYYDALLQRGESEGVRAGPAAAGCQMGCTRSAFMSLHADLCPIATTNEISAP